MGLGVGNRGLSRITQIARILRIFVYLRFWSGERGYGYYGLRTQTGKFAVQRLIYRVCGIGERAMNRTTTNRRAIPLTPLVRGNEKSTDGFGI